MQSDLIRDEGHAVIENSDIAPQKSVRVRHVPTGYRMSNVLQMRPIKTKEIPVKRCAVCCRLLYKEEYCALWKKHQTKIEEQFVQDQSAALANGASRESIESMT